MNQTFTKVCFESSKDSTPSSRFFLSIVFMKNIIELTVKQSPNATKSGKLECIDDFPQLSK